MRGGQSQRSSGLFGNMFGNPMKQTRNVLIKFSLKVFAFLLILKLSWNTLKAILYKPIEWMTKPYEKQPGQESATSGAASIGQRVSDKT